MIAIATEDGVRTAEALGVSELGGHAVSALAASDDNYVNVATKAGQGDAGNVPACSVRRPDVLNVCALWERGPVVLACRRVVERVERSPAGQDVRREQPW